MCVRRQQQQRRQRQQRRRQQTKNAPYMRSVRAPIGMHIIVYVRCFLLLSVCVCSRARAGASQATPSPWIVGTDSVLCTLCVARARAIRGPAYASCCGDDSAHRCGCCWMLMLLRSSMPMPSVSVSGDGAVACVWVVWWAKLFAADRRAVQISWRICFCSSFCCCTSD